MDAKKPTADMTPSLRRPLGTVETLFALFNPTGMASPTAMVGLSHPLDQEHLRQAVRWVFQRHPLLQIKLEENDGQYAFVPGAALPEVLVKSGGRETALACIETLLHEVYDLVNGPLWGVSLVSSSENQSQYMLVHMQHVIEDGMTIQRLIHDLLTCCASLSHNETLPPAQMLPLLKPVELATMARPSLMSILASGGRMFGRLLFPQQMIADEVGIPVTERRTKVEALRLDKETTSALLSACRANETTVHGALGAALLIGIASVSPKPLPRWFGLDSSVSLRPFCVPPIDMEHLGAYFSSVSWMFRVKKSEDFWALARDVRFRVKQRVERREPLHNLALLSWLKLNPTTVKKLMTDKDGRARSVFVSNLGRYAFDTDYGPFRLEEFYAGTGEHGMGACRWLAAVTVNGQLNLTFLHVDPLMSEETARSMTRAAVDALREACAVT